MNWGGAFLAPPIPFPVVPAPLICDKADGILSLLLLFLLSPSLLLPLIFLLLGAVHERGEKRGYCDKCQISGR